MTAVDINKPSDGRAGETTAGTEASYTPTSGSTNQIQVNWNSVAGAVAYNIYRTRTGGASGAERLLAQVPGNQTSFTDTFPDPPSGNAVPPSANTTGAGREVKQNTSPISLLSNWVEPNAGLSGGPGALVTKILTVTPPNQVTLNFTWPFPVPATNLSVTWGIDDSGAIQSAYDAATAGTYGRSVVFFPAGQYMTTRPLTIGRPNGAAGLVICGAGNYPPPWSPGAFPASVSTSSTIVFAGHPSQPIIQLDGAVFTCFRDLAIYGPAGSYQTTPQLLAAPAAGILERTSDPGLGTDQLLIENVSIGFCATGLLMDNRPNEKLTGELRCHQVLLDTCLNFGLRDLNAQGVDYQFRSVNVQSNFANPGFVAVQFDAGGCFRWEGGDLVSVGTVLRIPNQGLGPGSSNITLSDLRLEQNTNMQRVIVDTYTNPGQPTIHGLQQSSTIVVENVTELGEAAPGAFPPLFYLGPNTNVTVRSCTLYRAPLAALTSVGAQGVVNWNDTTLLLDGVSYANQVPFAAAITADAGSYWRSRNCRTNGNTGTPRFDESNWPGDGVVAPFRALFFTLYGINKGGVAGYFRPGNRQQKIIANEWPMAQIIPGVSNAPSGLAYGQCTGVYRNSDPYVSGAPVPVLPALPEDAYPGWFDGNSYITMVQGSYSTIFNLPANGSAATVVWIRVPASVVMASPPSNPICGNLRTGGTTAGYGGWLLDLQHNVPVFTVYNNVAPGTMSAVNLGTPVSGDTWYMLAAVEDIPNQKLLIYLFGPNNPLGISSFLNITPPSQQASTSTGACTIGENANAAPVVNAKMFIEAIGMIGLAPTLTQLQNLYSTGVNGG